MNILKDFDEFCEGRSEFCLQNCHPQDKEELKKFIKEKILKIVMSVPCKDRLILKNPHYTAHIKEVKKWRDNILKSLK